MPRCAWRAGGYNPGLGFIMTSYIGVLNRTNSTPPTTHTAPMTFTPLILRTAIAASARLIRPLAFTRPYSLAMDPSFRSPPFTQRVVKAMRALYVTYSCLDTVQIQRCTDTRQDIPRSWPTGHGIMSGCCRKTLPRPRAVYRQRCCSLTI